MTISAPFPFLPFSAGRQFLHVMCKYTKLLMYKAQPIFQDSFQKIYLSLLGHLVKQTLLHKKKQEIPQRKSLLTTIKYTKILQLPSINITQAVLLVDI